MVLRCHPPSERDDRYAAVPAGLVILAATDCVRVTRTPFVTSISGGGAVTVPLDREELGLFISVRVLDYAEPGLTTSRRRDLLSGRLDRLRPGRLHDPHRYAQPAHRTG